MDIKSKKEQLQRELAALEKVEALMNDPIARKLLEDSSLTPRNEPQVRPAMATNYVNHYAKSRKIVNTGARKAIALALTTGPTSLNDLARALVWNQEFTGGIIWPMVRKGYVEYNEGNGMFILTATGREMAQWFIRNPRFKTYQKYLTENPEVYKAQMAKARQLRHAPTQ